MGNLTFRDRSEKLFCEFNTKIFLTDYPELTILFYSSIIGALFYLLLVAFILRAKSRALKNADSSAAVAVVLPSYLPLLYLGFCSALTQILVVLLYASLCDSAYLDLKPWLATFNWLNIILYSVYVFSYDWFVNTIIFMFFMKSVSKKSFIKAFLCGFVLGIITSSLSGIAIDYVDVGGKFRRGFEYFLLVTVQIIQLTFLFILYFCVPGRRSSSNLFLLHSLTWRIIQLIAHIWSLCDGPVDSSVPPSIWIILLIQLIRTAILPIVVYWTLLRDTWYWRGVSRRKRLSRHAIQLGNNNHMTNVFSHPEAAGGLGRWLAQPRYPPGDPANDRLQQLLDDNSDLVIDHAFLSIDYERLLGRGASASVFHGRLTLLWGGGFLSSGFSVSGAALLAADPRETRARSVEVAVKICTPPELDEEAILAIKDETASWGQLSKIANNATCVVSESQHHGETVLLNYRPPNLVRFFGMCVMPPHLSLVFEYCEGGALADWINKPSPPPNFSSRLGIVHDCALACHFLHINGFIHRDIKSSNYLLKKGVALLTDFGTCVQNSFPSEYNHIVMRGTTVGTLDHMAPELLSEQDSGGRVYSNASDIYALGVVVASVIAFRLPFPNLREWDIRKIVLNGEHPFDLEDFVFQHNPQVKTWIKRAFHWNPTERPTALELIEICEASRNQARN